MNKLIIIIIFIAAFLRFYQLGVNPPSINWDEASIGYNAYAILKTGADEYGNKLPLSFRSFDDYKPPLYVYLTIPSVALFGLTEFAVRFPSAIIGVLAVVVTYFLVKELLSGWDNKKKEYIALLSSFVLAISPWHLQFSRAAFEGSIGLFFVMTGLWLFLRGLKNGKFFVASSAAFVLSLYSYHSFRLLIPLLLLFLIGFFWKKLQREILFSAVSIVLFLTLSIPIFVSLLGTGGAGSRLAMVTIFSDQALLALSAKNVAAAKTQHNIFGEIVNNRRIIFIPTIVRGYFDHFNFDFLFLHGDGGVQHHAYNMGMLYLWDFPFILLGVWFLLRKINRKIAALIILFLLAPLPSAITTGTPHPVRAIAMIPGFQIFSAVGIVGLYIWVRKKYTSISYGVLFCSAAGLMVNVIYYFNQYYGITPIQYGYFWQYGNKQALAYAKKNEENYAKIIMTYSYDQPYIYYLFYNKVDPSWYQKNWNYHGNGEVDRFYRKIGKYEFKNITWSRDSKQKNTLLIATPQEIPAEVHVDYEIFFPDGRLAYKIVSL